MALASRRPYNSGVGRAMRRLCTYLITNDTGLAPNPYWDYCTLAVCTPNHQGAKLCRGDWIAGFLTKDRNYRFVYAMEISERLHLDHYFHDPRFRAKRPNLRGDWMQRCGDNFYSQIEDGAWKQHHNRFHIGPKFLAKDTRRPFVFVGTRFWYFGREAMCPPERFLGLVGGRGIRVKHDESLAAGFRNWVETYREGVHALPNDNPDVAASPIVYGLPPTARN